MTGDGQRVTGTAAGVPFVALPPKQERPDSPVVIAWHLMDPPRSETAFASAVPMNSLDAWRFYFGLPMFVSRIPAGGFEQVLALATEDAVLKLYEPVFNQALFEFEPALGELRERFSMGSGPVALVGGSAGGAIALLVMTESSVPVKAAVLINPMVKTRVAVDAMSKHFGVTYAWSERSLAAGRRFDFVARAQEIALRGAPAVKLIVGENDDTGFKHPAALLKEALAGLYEDPNRVDLAIVPGMGHGFVEEPGLEPAPQTPDAAEVDRLTTDWLRKHLR